jgi:hypothetical protein
MPGETLNLYAERGAGLAGNPALTSSRVRLGSPFEQTILN